MYTCPFCRKQFKAPKTKCQSFIRELDITGMCAECFERNFNTAVVSDWGEELGVCYNCERPFYQKDLDKSSCCTCGTSYTTSMQGIPNTPEEWKEAFNKAIESCPRLMEVAKDLVESVTSNICSATVNNAYLTLMCESPLPDGEDPEGLDYVMLLLERYVIYNWD